MRLYLEYTASDLNAAKTPTPTKLAWLEQSGYEVSGVTPHTPNVNEEACVLVAYTRNPFEATALMFEQREIKRFTTQRPDARWFRIPVALLSRGEQSHIKPVRR